MIDPDFIKVSLPLERTIYIAGSSRDLERADAAIAMARDAGWKVTLDWPAEIRAQGGMANEGLPEALAYEAARQCRLAAVRARVMWLLLDSDHRSAGAHVELGYRLASHGHFGLYLTGPRPSSSIHYSGAYWAGHDDQAMGIILRQAGGAK